MSSGRRPTILDFLDDDDDLTLASKSVENVMRAGLIEPGGDVKACEEMLLNVLDRNPSHGAAWAELGVLKYFQDDYDDALASLHKALEVGYSNQIVYFNIGRVRDVQGDKQKAIEAYLQSLEMEPTHVQASALANLSSTLCSVGRYEEAIDAGKKALKIDDMDQIARLNMSVAYDAVHRPKERDDVEAEILKDKRSLRDVKKAIEAVVSNRYIRGDHKGCVKAWKCYSANHDIHMVDEVIVAQLVDSLNEVDNSVEANRILAMMVEGRPDNINIHSLMGQQMLYYTLKPEQAVSHFQFVIEHDVDSTGKLREEGAASLLRLSSAYSSLKMYDKVVDICTEGLKKGVSDPFTKANLHFNRGLAKYLLEKTDGNDGDFLQSFRAKLIVGNMRTWIKLRTEESKFTMKWLKSVGDKLSPPHTKVEVDHCIVEALDDPALSDSYMKGCCTVL